MAAQHNAQQSATPVSVEKAPRRAGVPHNRSEQQEVAINRGLAK
jgi:hypothetical protein